MRKWEEIAKEFGIIDDSQLNNPCFGRVITDEEEVVEKPLPKNLFNITPYFSQLGGVSGTTGDYQLFYLIYKGRIEEVLFEEDCRDFSRDVPDTIDDLSLTVGEAIKKYGQPLAILEITGDWEDVEGREESFQKENILYRL